VKGGGTAAENNRCELEFGREEARLLGAEQVGAGADNRGGRRVGIKRGVLVGKKGRQRQQQTMEGKRGW